MSEKTKPPVPAAVYLVADNLDAVLAAGEDLLRLQLDCAAATVDRSAASTTPRMFVEQVRILEMMVAARVLQARARAIEVRAADQRYRSLIGLFVGGTAALEDAVAELGDSTVADFNGGLDPVSYLRARGVVAADAAGLRDFGAVKITETFRVAERIELGPLMDLCATFLDRLEDHYELYEHGEGEPETSDKAA